VNEPRAIFVVTIWIEPGQVERFEAFESRVAGLMQRYGGVIERVVRLSSATSGTEPFEIHIVSFPDSDAFDRYGQDPEVLALASWRSQVITRTEISRGYDSPPYRTSSAHA
jgi:uncharacterized protein (DUF1330 family)